MSDTLKLPKVTEALAAWLARTAPDVVASITHVQLRGETRRGGYDIHISAWNADQLIVDSLASALGCPTNEGWYPGDDSPTAWQWTLDVERGGLHWHVTATRDKTEAER